MLWSVQEELAREYDIAFGFCIPNSVNTWEAEYDMPLYNAEQVREFVRPDSCLLLLVHILLSAIKVTFLHDAR
jgi:hypothetical protein